MNHPVIAFLPCRRGSQRVPKKNIKPFAGAPFGLVEIKLRQLLSCSLVDGVVLSTNDEEILEYAKSLNDSRLAVHQRSEILSSSETSTDELVAHALALIPQGHILWTHVTSPFVTAQHYEKIIRVYREKLNEEYDSLMTTTALQTFLWQDGVALNYDRTQEKWPRTQTLKPIHEVNSAAFLASCDIYDCSQDRIGRNPYLYELDKLTSHDIDWPEDFLVGECLVEKGAVEL